MLVIRGCRAALLINDWLKKRAHICGWWCSLLSSHNLLTPAARRRFFREMFCLRSSRSPWTETHRYCQNRSAYLKISWQQWTPWRCCAVPNIFWWIFQVFLLRKWRPVPLLSIRICITGNRNSYARTLFVLVVTLSVFNVFWGTETYFKFANVLSKYSRILLHNHL